MRMYYLVLFEKWKQKNILNKILSLQPNKKRLWQKQKELHHVQDNLK